MFVVAQLVTTSIAVPATSSIAPAVTANPAIATGGKVRIRVITATTLMMMAAIADYIAAIA